jgi:broad specificity phosphatase PhoE
MPQEIILLRHGFKIKGSNLPDLEVPLIDPNHDETLAKLYKSAASELDLANLELILHSDAPRTLQTVKYLYQLTPLVHKYNEIPKIEIPDSYKMVSDNQDLQNLLEQIYTQTVSSGNRASLNSFASNKQAFEAIINKGEKIKTEALKFIQNQVLKPEKVLIISHEIVLQAIVYAFLKSDAILNTPVLELEGFKLDLETEKVYPIKRN